METYLKMKFEFTKSFSEKWCYRLKWLLLPLALVALGAVCTLLMVIQSEPARDLAKCRQELQNISSLLENFELKLAESETSLQECHRQSILQREKIMELEKQMKELQLLNANLTEKQKVLQAAAEKQQEKINECERKLTTTRDHLQRQEDKLNQCQWDREKCQQQLSLHGHANAMHGPSIFCLILSLVALKLLCG
uniref:golgin subfamily A member 6-like protein 22 isoform X1 n=1 Tax=Pristiophorus japonicus TaxID=55135 RepID=UPI00398ECF4B